MGTYDLLLMGIECSVAFAGFAGIIATFQFSDRTSVKRGDVVGLTMIVQNSLAIAFACTLPLVLRTFDLKDQTIWAAVSVYGAFSMMFSSYSIDKSMRGAVRKTSLKLLFGSMQAISALIAICLILNASDIIFHRQPGPYIVALTANLGLVGYMFARLLLRPLWHAVRSQERAMQSAAANN